MCVLVFSDTKGHSHNQIAQKMEFERFAINLTGDILFVIPQGDDKYIIYRQDDRLGIVGREWNNGEATWRSPDLMDADLVKQIGNAIEDQEA